MKPSLRIALVVSLVALLVPPVFARDPWVTQTGLTGEQLASRLETFATSTYGVAPEQISGYEEFGAIRYAALWGPRTDAAPRQVLFGRTALQLTQQNSLLQSAGWRLHWINGFHFNGTDYYNAVYRRTHGVSQQLRIGQTYNDHLATRGELSASGHFLENLTVFRSGGINIRHTAFWNQANIGPQTEVSYALSPAELNSAAGSRSSLNWRVHSLCGYSPAVIVDGIDTRYTVIWRRPAFTGPWGLIPGLDKANYFAADSNNVGIGWRPTFLQGWKHGDGVKFNAMWAPNGGLDINWINRIDTLVNDARAAEDIPALSLAISRQGRLVFKRAYGLADTATNEWAGTDHRFRFASVAKAITGAAVVHAIQHQSARTLDSTIFGAGALFGDTYGSQPYSDNERAITIRHLLHHTHGWSGEGRLWWHDHPAYGSDPNAVIDWQLDNVGVTFTPGTRGRYSNFGYVVAARVVERLTGQTYEEYVTNRLFAPSGISGLLRPRIGGRTKLEKQFMEVSNYPHTTDTDGPYNIDHRRMDGSTGWVGRPSDLLLLGRRLDGDATHADILSAASITVLHTRGNPGSSLNYGWRTYGLGWYTDDYNNPGFWGHNGSMNGTRAEFIVGTNGTSFAWAANKQAEISNPALEAILNDITAANAWPDIDLFGVYHPAYNAWVVEHFNGVERGQPGLEHLLWNPAADPDGDGLPNAAEFYHGLDPRRPDRSPYTVTRVGNELRIRWLRKTGIEGAVMGFRTGTDLKSWGPRPLLSLLHQWRITDRNDLISLVGYAWQEFLIPANADRRFLRFHYEIR